MSTLTIYLAQTGPEAAVIFISFLLVASAIGYLTSWQYYKSSYKKDINALNEERHALKKKVNNLETTIAGFGKDQNTKGLEIEHLVLEVKALKALHAEAIWEKDGMALKNKRNEQLLNEKDVVLTNIAQKKHLLDYKSFGTATIADKEDLKMISGIGPFIEERLHALDIFTIKQISNFTANDIDTINDAIEYFSGRIDRDGWVAQAKEILSHKENSGELLNKIRERKVNIHYKRIGVSRKEEADDLTIISGIGGWIRDKLNALDIYTFRQISNFNKEDVIAITEAIEYFPGRIERDEWILQARDLIRIAGKKTDLLKRIWNGKGRIYYDRLGIAHKHEANNLTLIDGLGSWVEERLNTIGIYTFEQISRLSHSDISTITEILEIIPGRIEEDNWVKQARLLKKEQQLSN